MTALNVTTEACASRLAAVSNAIAQRDFQGHGVSWRSKNVLLTLVRMVVHVLIEKVGVLVSVILCVIVSSAFSDFCTFSICLHCERKNSDSALYILD